MKNSRQNELLGEAVAQLYLITSEIVSNTNEIRANQPVSAERKASLHSNQELSINDLISSYNQTRHAGKSANMLMLFRKHKNQ